MRLGAPTIGDGLARPSNGFTLVRLLLALAVVVSHAFSVTTGSIADEPLARTTGFTLGEHAVNGFFAISGFLVTMSFARRGWRDFVVARFLRIAPGLVVAALLVTLGLGSALTTLGVSAYLTDPGTWGFLVGLLTTFKTNAALPGVFADNPVRMPMGTVWTLKYEVFCYLGVLAAGLAGLLRRPWSVALLALALLVAIMVVDLRPPLAGKAPETSLRLSFLFATGAALYLWRDAVRLSWVALAILALATWLAAGSAAYRGMLFACEAYGALWLAFLPVLARPGLDLAGDASYGTYLYGWPIQQALRQLVPDAGAVALLVPSLAITLAVAVASWLLVEAPALALKARTLGRRTIRTIEPAAP